MRLQLLLMRRRLSLAGLLTALAATAQPQPAGQATNQGEGAKLPPPKSASHTGALKYRKQRLQDEHGNIPADAWMRALEQRQQVPVGPLAWPGHRPAQPPKGPPGGGGTTNSPRPLVGGIESFNWTWLGPGNIGGRVRSIVFDYNTPSTIYVGGVDGGVWKTTSAGSSWAPLDDFMANLAVSCLVMDPVNSSVLYAGTGEGYGNVDAVQGAGIFKTLDGGATWSQLASTASASFFWVNRLTISPANNQVLLAATGSGIYRSTDSGTSWTRTYAGGIDDVAYSPNNGLNCIASGYGVLLWSTNAGVSWFNATGLSGARRIEVAYAPSSPSTVYASAEKNLGELYVSGDGGHSYSLRNTGTHYFGSSADAEQGWYDNCLWVDPTNPNLLVLGGLDLWRSSDGGTTLTDIGGYSGGVHPDQHCLVSSPGFDGSGNKTVLVGNDGGVFMTANIYTTSGSSGWSSLNHNLGITQFYGVAGNPSTGTVVGGAQDNGTLRYTPGGGAQGWTSMFGGDGGFVAADQTDSHYFYGEYVYLQIFRSTDSGASAGYIDGGIGDASIADDDDDSGGDHSANFIAPFILDPNNANTLLAGGSNLWRSVNVKASTPTWTAIKSGVSSGSFISAVAVAPGNSDVVWVGYGDGEVYATANGTAASPSWTRKDRNGTTLPVRYCTRIAIDPSNASVVYVTFGGFSSGNVWRSGDGGSTWKDISSNLPQAPVNSLVVHPHDSTYLYVGTQVGVFASENTGQSWSTSNDGPANVAVDELSWMGDVLLAGTHGRGCFSIQPTYWVQYGLSSSGNGTYASPFNTLAQGLNTVPPGGAILFKYPGSTPEKPSISKRMTISAVGGPATIGR